MVLGEPDSYMQKKKKKKGNLITNLYKNKFKVDKRLKYKL